MTLGAAAGKDADRCWTAAAKQTEMHTDIRDHSVTLGAAAGKGTEMQTDEGDHSVTWGQQQGKGQRCRQI